MTAITLPGPAEDCDLFAYTTRHLEERLRAGERALAAATADSWPAERERRRRMLARVLVPDWPKPDPAVVETGRIDRPAWRITKLRFPSLPDYWVTANLYVPTIGPPPYPGMIVASGHMDAAKAYHEYHGISEDLARQGMVVLAFDPVSQGERVQGWDWLRNRWSVGSNTSEHDIMGVRALLCGWPLAQAFVWDAMRAIDVLLARPEVDARRVGMCGVSGGGTQTTWTLAADDRLTAAAPACFITSWRQQLAAKLGADPEQHPFPALAWGWDQADILASFAPKPLLIVATKPDFFPIDGTRATFARLCGLYETLHASGSVDLFQGETEHGYFPPLREATVSWFCRQFDIPYDGKGITENPVPPADLSVTRTGQLVTSGFRRTLHDVIEGSRPNPLGARMGEETFYYRDRWQQRRRDTLRELLGIPSDPVPARARRIDEESHDRAVIERWALQPEEGIEVPVLVARPNGEPRGAVLHAHESGVLTDWNLPGGPVWRLLDAGWAIISVDPRGTGAGSIANGDERRSGRRFGPEQHVAWTWTMMDRPLLGQRVFDLLQTAAWACRRPGFEGLSLAATGIGEAAIWALFAAALDLRIDQVVLHGGPCDFARMLVGRDVAWHASAIPPKMLTWGDLPQTAALVAPRPLTIIAPVDGERRPVTAAMARSTYRLVAKLYEEYGAGTFHLVSAGCAPEDVAVDWREWLTDGR